MSTSQSIVPVVLAGGGGTRLWPLSRGHYPKQFLAVGGTDSLLQRTVGRFAALPETPAAPVVVCNEEHRFLVAEQLRQAGVVADLVLEPAGRNTAPALCVAALRALALAGGDDPVLVVMPADHLVGDLAAFGAALVVALEQARAGRVVTFGVTPTRAETGYGYIETGARVGSGEPCCRELAAFREKPDAETAAAYLAGGRHLWNAGIFIVRAGVWLQQARAFCPDIVAAAEAAVAAGSADGDFFRLDRAGFEASPADSIDYAVMEPLSGRAGEAVVVELDAAWSDVGSWAGLWQVSPQDGQGNVLEGDVCAIESSNNLVHASHRLVATLGVSGLAVVETADAVLVADLGRTEAVKEVVAWLSSRNREERLTHRRVYRPWGSYESIDDGPRFQVKRITVSPGAALSLQMHHHRAEHWIVVSGAARVTRGEESFLLGENESTYIPLGAVHRLENPGTLPLELIEVQSGAYLGEDDIVRFDDRYRRQ